jgi:polyphosphate kinase 2 (PPK2 family)
MLVELHFLVPFAERARDFFRRFVRFLPLAARTACFDRKRTAGDLARRRDGVVLHDEIVARDLVEEQLDEDQP